jgi:two-component system, LytTR family, response regulator
MTVLVVDDERRSRERLSRLLRGLADVSVVAEAQDGPEALTAIAQCQLDAVFLDVQMPGMSGFDVLSAIPAIGRPSIVFVTAYDEHALAAFDVSALDYLVKPVTEERLFRAVSRIRERMAPQRQDAPQSPPTPRPLRRIVGRQRQTYHVLPLESIEAFVADQTLVFAVTDRGRFLVDATLRDLEARLGTDRFTRVHKQTIVNLGHLRELTPLSRGGATARLRSGTTIEVSRRYAQSLRQVLPW